MLHRDQSSGRADLILAAAASYLGIRLREGRGELGERFGRMVDHEARICRREMLGARHERRRVGSTAAVALAKESRPVDPFWLLFPLMEGVAGGNYVDETVTHVADIAESPPNEGFGSYVRAPHG
jgi:hypothetical protein